MVVGVLSLVLQTFYDPALLRIPYTADVCARGREICLQIKFLRNRARFIASSVRFNRKRKRRSSVKMTYGWAMARHVMCLDRPNVRFSYKLLRALCAISPVAGAPASRWTKFKLLRESNRCIRVLRRLECGGTEFYIR